MVTITTMEYSLRQTFKNSPSLLKPMSLVDILKDAEKYLVRVPDEMVYKGVDTIVRRIEKKGTSRRQQARILSNTSRTLTAGTILGNFLYDGTKALYS
jgi:hypothetical protein